MWSILALGAVERLINQCINLDAITRIQFNQLQGKLLRVVMDTPQLSVDVYFDQNKIRLEPTVTGKSETPSIFEQRPFDKNVAIVEATATLHVKNVVELAKLFVADHPFANAEPIHPYLLLKSLLQKINDFAVSV